MCVCVSVCGVSGYVCVKETQEESTVILITVGNNISDRYNNVCTTLGAFPPDGTER